MRWVYMLQSKFSLNFEWYSISPTTYTVFPRIVVGEIIISNPFRSAIIRDITVYVTASDRPKVFFAEYSVSAETE